MKTYPSIRYNKRPKSYWHDQDPLTAILRNVMGTERRAMIRARWEDGNFEKLSEELTSETVNEDVRRGLGRIHPSFMGGEYLPPYFLGEREIARIELQSVTADVISVRARPLGSEILYRIVDEHHGVFTPWVETSDEPLSLGELIEFFELSELNELPGNLVVGYNEYNLPYSSHRELRNFTYIWSDLYRQLSSHFEHEFEAWVVQGEADLAEEEAVARRLALQRQVLDGGTPAPAWTPPSLRRDLGTN